MVPVAVDEPEAADEPEVMGYDMADIESVRVMRMIESCCFIQVYFKSIGKFKFYISR